MHSQLTELSSTHSELHAPSAITMRCVRVGGWAWLCDLYTSDSRIRDENCALWSPFGPSVPVIIILSPECIADTLVERNNRCRLLPIPVSCIANPTAFCARRQKHCKRQWLPVNRWQGCPRRFSS